MSQDPFEQASQLPFAYSSSTGPAAMNSSAAGPRPPDPLFKRTGDFVKQSSEGPSPSSGLKPQVTRQPASSGKAGPGQARGRDWRFEPEPRER